MLGQCGELPGECRACSRTSCARRGGRWKRPAALQTLKKPDSGPADEEELASRHAPDSEVFAHCTTQTHPERRASGCAHCDMNLHFLSRNCPRKFNGRSCSGRAVPKPTRIKSMLFAVFSAVRGNQPTKYNNCTGVFCGRFCTVVSSVMWSVSLTRGPAGKALEQSSLSAPPRQKQTQSPAFSCQRRHLTRREPP